MSTLQTGRLDRTCLDISSKLAEPFCRAYEYLRYRLVAPLGPKFDNYANRVQEIAFRIFIVLVALAIILACIAFPLPMIGGALALGIVSRVFRAIGFYVQKDGYTYVQGDASEKILDPKNPKVSIATWNICGIRAGMSKDHGGVVDILKYRINEIVAKIEAEDPDVLILDEVYDTAVAEAFISRLPRYRHVFAHMGPSVFGSVSGVMVFSKCAVHDFSFTSFKNNSWTINRGFASLELKTSSSASSPCLRVVCTHLTCDAKEKMEQVAQIVDTVAHKKLMPTVLAGDLNIERDEEEGTLLSKHLLHGYKGSEPTCTNRLIAEWYGNKAKPDETIDYLSLFKIGGEGVRFRNCHLIRAFDSKYDTLASSSDHHGIFGEVEVIA